MGQFPSALIEEQERLAELLNAAFSLLAALNWAALQQATFVCIARVLLFLFRGRLLLSTHGMLGIIITAVGWT